MDRLYERNNNNKCSVVNLTVKYLNISANTHFAQLMAAIAECNFCNAFFDVENIEGTKH